MSLRLTLLSLLAILPACGDPKPQTTEDTDASSGSSASSGEATDGTVGMSSAPTTGDVTATTDGSDSMTSSVTTSAGTTTSATDGNATEDPATTSASTTASETTGPVDPDIAEHCNVVCGQLVECKVMDDLATCISECSAGFSDADPACTAANSELLACIETLDCAQIVAFFVDEDPGPCAKQFEAQNLACQSNECIGSIGSNEQGTECSITSECANEPILEMNCDATTCTCTSGGEKTGECPSEGVCGDIDLLDTKAEACCGF